MSGCLGERLEVLLRLFAQALGAVVGPEDACVDVDAQRPSRTSRCTCAKGVPGLPIVLRHSCRSGRENFSWLGGSQYHPSVAGDNYLFAPAGSGPGTH